LARRADPSQPSLPLVETPAPLPQAALSDAQRLACLRLIRSENIGPVTFRELINRYGGAQRALEALPEISRKSGRTLRICPVETAEQELAAAHRIGARPLFTIEPDYPPLLAHLEMPPPLIYAKGRLDLLTRPAMAIVGSRDASAAGRTLARTLSQGLAAAGLVIVSGLARGIDAEAHQAALHSGTIAVLAGGVDMVYPPENAELYAEMCDIGCIVSEMPPGFVPRGQDFPRRNRIISGISNGVVVIEAAKRSGTLITARMASEQGREVFAVPGHPLDPRAEGTNHLIKNGATMVTSANDVLEILGPSLKPRFHFREPDPPPNEPGSLPERHDGGPERIAAETTPETSSPPHDAEGERARVLAALGPVPVNIDGLVRVTGLSARVIQAAVLELSLLGQIERHGQNLISSVVTQKLPSRTEG
jgi:DNA processing protein